MIIKSSKACSRWTGKCVAGLQNQCLSLTHRFNQPPCKSITIFGCQQLQRIGIIWYDFINLSPAFYCVASEPISFHINTIICVRFVLFLLYEGLLLFVFSKYVTCTSDGVLSMWEDNNTDDSYTDTEPVR